MTIQATVILPTFGRADFVLWAIKSIQQQTVRDIEIFIIGDGAAPETVELIREAARSDSRIRFFEHEKGALNGEIYRHQAILEAEGRVICYLGHDDLWFPDHIAAMLEMLKDGDFGHSLFTYLAGTGEVSGLTPLASDYATRVRMADRRWNRFGPSNVAHTREMYLALPDGYQNVPGHLWSDLYLWRQFIHHPACRITALPRTTALSFPRSSRRDWSNEKREAELENWFSRLTMPGESERLTGLAFQGAAVSALHEIMSLERVLFPCFTRTPAGAAPRPSRLSLVLARILVLLRNRPGMQRLKDRLTKEMVRRSGLYHADFYLGYNMDIPRDCGDPLAHFLSEGGRQGKLPSPAFDVSAYLTSHQDVLKSGVNALVHYLLFGYRERRAASGLRW